MYSGVCAPINQIEGLWVYTCPCARVGFGSGWAARGPAGYIPLPEVVVALHLALQPDDTSAVHEARGASGFL